MARFLQIIFFCFAGLLLAGCPGQEKDKPIWEQVKIGDLAPITSSGARDSQLLRTINFDIYIFEVPAENIGQLDDIWQMLFQRQLHFYDHEAFVANSFSAGFGEIAMWNEIGEVLRNAGARKIETVSMLLTDGRHDDLYVKLLEENQSVFYISTDGSMKDARLGPGKMVLRLKAESIAGARGTCKLTVSPAFSPYLLSSIPQIEAHSKLGDFLFTSTTFELTISPGHFIFLGPDKYIDNKVSLGGLFFSKFSPRPVARIFLIFCTSIID